MNDGQSTSTKCCVREVSQEPVRPALVGARICLTTVTGRSFDHRYYAFGCGWLCNRWNCIGAAICSRPSRTSARTGPHHSEVLKPTATSLADAIHTCASVEVRPLFIKRPAEARGSIIVPEYTHWIIPLFNAAVILLDLVVAIRAGKHVARRTRIVFRGLPQDPRHDHPSSPTKRPLLPVWRPQQHLVGTCRFRSASLACGRAAPFAETTGFDGLQEL